MEIWRFATAVWNPPPLLHPYSHGITVKYCFAGRSLVQTSTIEAHIRRASAFDQVSEASLVSWLLLRLPRSKLWHILELSHHCYHLLYSFFLVSFWKFAVTTRVDSLLFSDRDNAAHLLEDSRESHQLGPTLSHSIPFYMRCPPSTRLADMLNSPCYPVLPPKQKLHIAGWISPPLR